MSKDLINEYDRRLDANMQSIETLNSQIAEVDNAAQANQAEIDSLQKDAQRSTLIGAAGISLIMGGRILQEEAKHPVAKVAGVAGMAAGALLAGRGLHRVHEVEKQQEPFLQNDESLQKDKDWLESRKTSSMIRGAGIMSGRAAVEGLMAADERKKKQ